MPNPYPELIDALVDALLAEGVRQFSWRQMRADFVSWDPDNEWLHTNLAGYLMALAYAWQAPDSRHHHSEPVRDALLPLFADLVASAHEDRWWHREGRQGDPNIDRFTLVPFLEAFFFAREALPADLARSVTARCTGVLAVQYREYGETKLPGHLYPNMDVYYCLLMFLGHQLTGEARYHQDFLRFLDLMEQAQFPGGAWTYLNGSNECPVYHDINVCLMARLWQLSGDPRALQMVQRSAPYYPQVVDPCGRPEYFTDPWWKHSWHKQDPFAPDLVASLSADPANRALGDQLRKALPARLHDLGGQVDAPEMVWAAALWSDVDSAAHPPSSDPRGAGVSPASEPSSPAKLRRPPRPDITFDPNLEGPRGRFADWSWAATARHGSDTLVGAVLHTPTDSPVVTFLGLTAEIEYQRDGQPDANLTRYALGMTPPGTRGETTITPAAAVFAASYTPACFRSVWDAEPFPHRWECRQCWEMTAHQLSGQVSLRQQDEALSPPPLIRLRFARHLDLTGEGDTYRCGPFRLTLDAPTLPVRAIRPCQSVLYLTDRDAVELLLRPVEPHCRVVSLNLTLEFIPPDR